MIVVSTLEAQVLAFRDLRELRGTIANLEGMAEWIERDGVAPPHLYSIRHDSVSEQQMHALLDALKQLPAAVFAGEDRGR